MPGGLLTQGESRYIDRLNGEGLVTSSAALLFSVGLGGGGRDTCGLEFL